MLALGSVLAGYIGIPHALGGGNRIERVPRAELPALAARDAVRGRSARCCAPAEAAAHGDERHSSCTLMALSIARRVSASALATYFCPAEARSGRGDGRTFPGLHRLLLNKYDVDELYDAAIVQPIKSAADEWLWRGVDAESSTARSTAPAQVVAAVSAVLRLLQSGSVAPMRRRRSWASC